MNLLIVGEAFGEREAEAGKPFVGPSGSVLNSLLRQSGIDRDEISITNVFNFRPEGNDIETLLTTIQADAAEGWPTFAPKKWFHKQHSLSLYDLTELRKALRPHVIIALGDTALWALTHHRGMNKYRGTPMLTFDGLHKVIATWHPAAILRQWDLRPVAFMDFQKAKRQAAFPELRRPERHIMIEPSLDDIANFYYDHIRPAPFLSVDIETKEGQITEIGFATSASRAIVIPFWDRKAIGGNYWPSAADEKRAWIWVRRILEEKPVIGQNFQYDMTYLYKTMGIKTRHFKGDTMLLHHAMQPELKKSLGFLGSIYSDEPAWKFMREGIETLKKED